ncbi:MAG: biotin/lipoate A/B protein ligase family protein [Candidatus Heimdallarchaeota archaeon]
MVWRLLRDRIEDCYHNMGLDEAILTSYAEGKVEFEGTIRFYRWNPSAVSIGYFQAIEKVLDLKECKLRGIDFIRRVTGGGAVYHDYEGELTYSLITPQSNELIPRDIMKSHELICNALITGLEQLGVSAAFSTLPQTNQRSKNALCYARESINDLTVEGQKISGNAQTRRKGVVLQHGTLLRQVDIEKMISVLNVSDEKTRNKMIKTVRTQVCSLEEVLAKEITFPELRDAIIQGFKKVFEIELILSDPTGEELDLAHHLAQKKYSSNEWLFMR